MSSSIPARSACASSSRCSTPACSPRCRPRPTRRAMRSANAINTSIPMPSARCAPADFSIAGREGREHAVPGDRRYRHVRRRARELLVGRRHRDRDGQGFRRQRHHRRRHDHHRLRQPCARSTADRRARSITIARPAAAAAIIARAANAAAPFQQLPNPVAAFATDNNGTILSLPAVPQAGVADADRDGHLRHRHPSRQQLWPRPACCR